MLVATPTLHRTTVSCLVMIVAITCSHPPYKEVEIQEVVSESACIQQRSDGEYITAIRFRLVPTNAALFYVKCYGLTYSTNWVYTYQAPGNNSKTEVFKLSNSFTHAWDPQNRTFTLIVHDPDTRWYLCKFVGVGKHKHKTAFTELLPLSPDVKPNHAFPMAVVSLEGRRHNPRHLRCVIGGSGCFPVGAQSVQLTWKVVPTGASLFHVKCYKTISPSSIEEDHQFLFTYLFATDKLMAGTAASNARLKIEWIENHGELSITIPNPSTPEHGEWYLCDFNGEGRHPHHKAFIQLIGRNPGNIEGATTLSRKDWDPNEYTRVPTTKPVFVNHAGDSYTGNNHDIWRHTAGGTATSPVNLGSKLIYLPNLTVLILYART